MRHAAPTSTVSVIRPDQSWKDECESLRREVAQLRVALDTRDTIGQAKGIVRLAFRCDDATAFAALSSASQNSNRKLRDVAGLVLDSALNGGSLPQDFAKSMQRSLDRGATDAEPAVPLIEQATEILARQRNASVDAAFTLLRTYCRSHGLRLAEVAHGLVNEPSCFPELRRGDG